jgi:hypothetical protein
MSRICTFVFFVLTCASISSCKKDSPTPNPGAKNFTLTSLQLDGQPFVPANGSTSLSPQITISFSDRIDHQSAQDNIVLTDGTGTVPVNYTFANNDSTVILQPVSLLKNFKLYIFQITANLASQSAKKYSVNSTYKVATIIDPSDKFPRISDNALLDSVQKRTLRYFWDFGHPASGMARERNTSGDLVTTGGSGFGLMTLVVGINRNFISRPDGVARFNKIVGFLETADRFHGAWPHWINGNTGKIIPFSPNDNGADLVETSFMIQGLLTVRQYLNSSDTVGNNLINRITKLYRDVEWDWFRRCEPNCQNVIYWHWSPDKAWIMNFPLYGYFEEQVTYILAAASPTHSIPKIVYTNGFGKNGAIVKNNAFYGHVLPLESPGPLFWVQYSYLGMNPHFSDDYTDYWTQNVNATLINQAYCIANPKKYPNYNESCWGLTASDNPNGYDAQSPSNDNGTITPTAALSSFPYAPDESMKALKFFYYTLGDRLWGPYGFYDAFNISSGWAANSTLAIDQGPIVIMIENYRTQLLWNLFMSAPEIQQAKTELGLH